MKCNFLAGEVSNLFTEWFIYNLSFKILWSLKAWKRMWAVILSTMQNIFDMRQCNPWILNDAISAHSRGRAIVPYADKIIEIIWKLLSRIHCTLKEFHIHQKSRKCSRKFIPNDKNEGKNRFKFQKLLRLKLTLTILLFNTMLAQYDDRGGSKFQYVRCAWESEASQTWYSG